MSLLLFFKALVELVASDTVRLKLDVSVTPKLTTTITVRPADE